ncbi:MAG: type II toxin-antitoxin system RelE/ParE family toxin [Planctomycetota bacterium]
MTYRLAYTTAYLNDLERHIDWLQTQGVAPHVIEQWYEPLFERIETLPDLPLSHPIDEAFSAELNQPVRKLIFGNYLIFYRIVEAQQRIEILSFRHGATRR